MQLVVLAVVSESVQQVCLEDSPCIYNCIYIYVDHGASKPAP